MFYHFYWLQNIVKFYKYTMCIASFHWYWTLGSILHSINNIAVNILIGSLCTHLWFFPQESRNTISISNSMKYTWPYSLVTCIECRHILSIQNCQFLHFLHGYSKAINWLFHCNLSIVFWYNCLSGISLFPFILFKGAHFSFISL